jgi:hypothetical protein
MPTSPPSPLSSLISPNILDHPTVLLPFSRSSLQLSSLTRLLLPMRPDHPLYSASTTASSDPSNESCLDHFTSRTRHLPRSSFVSPPSPLLVESLRPLHLTCYGRRHRSIEWTESLCCTLHTLSPAKDGWLLWLLTKRGRSSRRRRGRWLAVFRNGAKLRRRSGGSSRR